MYRQRSRGLSPMIIVALVMGGSALLRYCSNATINPLTGETQYISMSPEQEVAMGLQSVPQMAQQFGGLSRNMQATQLVERVGGRIINGSDAKNTPYKYHFHLLGDQRTVNAFALPGGQIFITEALLARLKSEDQLAGILGHEAGHVVARHSAEKLAQMDLAQGLTGAVTMAAYDPSGANAGAAIAQAVSNMLQLKYGRDQELQSDDLGVRFMIQAGYDPEALIDVMAILAEASGPSRVPEFQSTHPSPENRAGQIRASISKYKGR